MLYMGLAAYQRILAAAQVESAARMFAQDILSMRDRALSGMDVGHIVLDNDGKRYWIYRRPNLVEKKRGFASAGSESIRFVSIPANVIRFSINGVPQTSGNYILQHERFSSAKVCISLQPVTGRVQLERLR